MRLTDILGYLVRETGPANIGSLLRADNIYKCPVREMLNNKFLSPELRSIEIKKKD